MPIALLLQNWKLIVQIAGAVALAVLLWWYLIHNPKVIKELEEDKKELSRIIEAQQDQLKLNQDIEKGKVVINAAVQQRISSLRSEARPRRTVIVKAGVVLPPIIK